MTKSVPAMGGQNLDHHAFRVARTQREAGLEFFGWERRLKPAWPPYYDVTFAAVLLLAVTLGLLGYFLL